MQEKVFLKISQNSQENTCARVSFLIKLQVEACNFIKKRDPGKGDSCEFCEFSKNTFSYRTSPVTASVNISKAFDKGWPVGLLHKLKFYGISGQTFGLTLFFLCNKRLRVALYRKS